MIDIFLAAVVGIVTWTVAAEGAWGAGAIFLTVLLSGLVAMNFFEPAAGVLESILGSDWSGRVDIIALVGIFAVCVFGLRMLSERLVPSFIGVHGRIYDVCRWGFGFFTGYLTMAILLTSLHTAPLPRNFLGFTPERRNFFGALAPDREWLGFVQFISEIVRSGDDNSIFDGPKFQLPNHENQVWPTFIIRYASRRETFGSGSSGAVGTASGTDEIKVRGGSTPSPAPASTAQGPAGSTRKSAPGGM